MRVETIEKVPHTLSAGMTAGDASAAIAIKSFVLAMDSDDSLLRLVEPLSGPSSQVAEGGGFYVGEMTLEFREEEYGRNKSLYFLLVEKLIELLREAGSAETLRATLGLTTGQGDQGKSVALWIRLTAKGDSPEQAALRWGLALTHLQQALLFTSRHLRMQISHRS